MSLCILCAVLNDDSFSLFFFQAEDGIRDLTVTGVQTCALPISGWLAYDAAFRSLARRYPGFAYHPAVAGAAGAARDGASRLAETVTRLVADVTGLVAYVCGSESMIHRVRDVLVAKGLDRKSVKWEKFW